MDYTEEINPYKQWHMRRAFRLGWQAAHHGLDEQQAHTGVLNEKLNRQTSPAWWRGYHTQHQQRKRRPQRPGG